MKDEPRWLVLVKLISLSHSTHVLQASWPLLLGLAVLYVPAYYDMSHTLWNKEEQAHGPLILLASAWMFWQRREALRLPAEPSRLQSNGSVPVNDGRAEYELPPKRKNVTAIYKQPQVHLETIQHPFAGGCILIAGLLFYILGRSQDIIIFELGSQIPVLVGTLLITHGLKAVRALWFPLFFIVFMLPLPGFVVDAITGPLKQQVSALTEAVLYAVGYPIARSGVMLEIGPYQLLVADACSGLNSMSSLMALGILYLHLEHRGGILRNVVMVLSILPIAFGANVLRVMALVLITYYLGDEAGQGFLHGFAGIVLFISALTCLLSLDWLLGLVSQSY